MEKNTYRVWLRETAYYAVDVQAEIAEFAKLIAETTNPLPKPYDYSALIATKAQLIRGAIHISKKREDSLKRHGFRRSS